MMSRPTSFFFFFFNDTATTEIYTLSLHDALPIWSAQRGRPHVGLSRSQRAHDLAGQARPGSGVDRKSTRLNSSHSQISYAVFCLKKKKTQQADKAATTNDHLQSRSHTR